MAETSEKIPIAMAGPEEIEPCLPPAYTAETVKPSSSSRLLKIGAAVLIAGAALLLFGAIGAFYFWKVDDKHVYNIHYSMSINGKIEEGTMEIDSENNMEMFRTGSGPDEAVEVHDFHIGITGIRFSGGEKCFIKTQAKAHLPDVETLNKESLMFDLEDEIMPAQFDEESLIWVAADQPLKDNSFLSAKILELCGDLPIFWLRPTYPKGGRRRRDVQRGKRQAVTEAMAAVEITPTEQPVTKETVTEETTGMAETASVAISPTEETGTKEDITVGDAVTVEMTLADTVTGEMATVDTTYDPTAATEILSADPVTAEIASADLVTAGLPSADLVTVEIASADLVTAGISSGDLVTVEMASADLVTVEMASADLVTVEMASADLVTMEIASADLVTMEMASGDVITVEMTSGDPATMEMTSADAATVAMTPAEAAREKVMATEIPIPEPTVAEHKPEATTKKATVVEEDKEEEPPYNPENPYQQRNLEGEEGTMTFDPMLDHQGICCTECTRGHTHCQRICEPLGGYHPWPYHYRGCRVACRVIMPCRWWVGRILGIL